MEDTTIELTTKLLSVEKAYEAVVTESAGAVSTFVGTTRDCFDGKRVVRLEYEAYEPMAKAKLQQLCEEVELKQTHTSSRHR